MYTIIERLQIAKVVIFRDNGENRNIKTVKDVILFC